LETEIISSLIEGGCYSAVFAVLLFVSLKSGNKRENCYREVIGELVDGLRALDVVNDKLDRLIEMCEEARPRERKKQRYGSASSVPTGKSAEVGV